MQLLSCTSSQNSEKFSLTAPLRLRKNAISLKDQHTTYPQQIINEVTEALRPRAFTLELLAALT